MFLKAEMVCMDSGWRGNQTLTGGRGAFADILTRIIGKKSRVDYVTHTNSISYHHCRRTQDSNPPTYSQL